MRARRVAVALALGLVAVVVQPMAASATVTTVDKTVIGGMSGPGGFRFDGCPGVITVIGSGEYAATGLGRGTYAFRVCVISVSPLMFDGSITFTNLRGARVDGTIGGTVRAEGWRTT